MLFLARSCCGVYVLYICVYGAVFSYASHAWKWTSKHGLTVEDDRWIFDS